MNARQPILSRDAAAGLDLGLLGPRHHVARRQLHLARRVALHEPLAAGVLQVPALTAAGFRHQDAVRDQARRVELQELHVLEREASAVRHRHPVARHRFRVRREAVEAAPAAGGDEECLAAQHDGFAARCVDPEQTREAAALHQHVGHEELVVPGEALVAQQLIVQRLHLEEAGLVCGQRRARVGVPAERALRDAAVFVARPRNAPVVEPANFVRNRVDEAADDILVGQEVRPLVRVPRVQVDRVAFLGSEHGGRAALGADRVRAHQLHLRHDADVHAAIQARADLDGGTQAGESGTENENVVGQALSHPDLLASRTQQKRAAGGFYLPALRVASRCTDDRFATGRRPFDRRGSIVPLPQDGAKWRNA